jgi:hypothetical protein
MFEKVRKKHNRFWFFRTLFSCVGWGLVERQDRIPSARISGNSGFIGNRDLIRELRQEMVRWRAKTRHELGICALGTGNRFRKTTSCFPVRKLAFYFLTFVLLTTVLWLIWP